MWLFKCFCDLTVFVQLFWFVHNVSDDVFAIDEVTMFEGENWTEKKYAVAGDILDGYLYDLFMNMLDERGVNKEFADKLSEYCSGNFGKIIH